LNPIDLPANTADDDFQPPRWLRNRHVQSILSSTSWRRGRVLRHAVPLLVAQRELLLDCGAGVRLQAFVSSPAHSTGLPVVLLHGWEGSAESLYVLSLAQRVRAGFDRAAEPARETTAQTTTCSLLPAAEVVCTPPCAALPPPLQLVVLLGGNFMRVAAQHWHRPSAVFISPRSIRWRRLRRGIPNEAYFCAK
jgi:hypothetical protein